MLKVDFTTQLSSLHLSITFQLKNEIGVMYGKSGAGKTTILNTIAGLHSPKAGSISLHDNKLFESPKINLPPQKRSIGYVFQQYALFPHMTVLENIHYGVAKKERTNAEEHIHTLVDALNLTPLLHQYPSQLSGGEQQRVAFVRALAKKPDALLLDEPFSALDEETKNDGHEQLLRIKEEWDIPILLVTHNQQEAAKLADQRFLVENGTIHRK